MQTPDQGNNSEDKRLSMNVEYLNSWSDDALAVFEVLKSVHLGDEFTLKDLLAYSRMEIEGSVHAFNDAEDETDVSGNPEVGLLEIDQWVDENGFKFSEEDFNFEQF